MKMATCSKVKTFLETKGLYLHLVSFSNGVYTAKKSSYINSRRMLEALTAEMKRIEGLTVTDSGEHYHAFVGGCKAAGPQDSYIWMKFTMSENLINNNTEKK